MKLSVGIEGTYAPQSGKDTLSETGHFVDPLHDFQLVRELGITEVRYPIPWHRIERTRGEYDWSTIDAVLPRAVDELGLDIIADPLHHTSYPAWLSGGFLDSAFAESYVQFVEAFAERFPMVTCYTPFNEPTCTLDFCGSRGFWHPYAKGDFPYVKMLQSTAFAYAKVVRMLHDRSADIKILHVDTFEHHAALDEGSVERAAFLNHRRFLFEELVQGLLKPGHPLCRYLLDNGFPRKSLDWHGEHPVRIDERGGNYYPLNEEQLLEGRTCNAPSRDPRGFANVVQDYAARIAQPLSLTETNIQGSVSDRISWLKYMLEQTEQLAAAGVAMKRFAWYPLFDCVGWHCLLQGPEWQRDPQGIYSCGSAWNRLTTELSHCYKRMVKYCDSKALPAYEFAQRHHRTLGGLLRQMNWRWQSPPRELQMV